MTAFEAMLVLLCTILGGGWGWHAGTRDRTRRLIESAPPYSRKRLRRVGTIRLLTTALYASVGLALSVLIVLLPRWT